MERTAFEDFLDRYGADLSRWPESARAEAMSLMHRSEAARAAFAAMSEVESLLRVDTVPEAAFGTAIAARAMTYRQVRPLRPAMLGALWTGTASAVLLFGIVLGDRLSQHEETPNRVVATALDLGGAVDAD